MHSKLAKLYMLREFIGSEIIPHIPLCPRKIRKIISLDLPLLDIPLCPRKIRKIISPDLPDIK